ncbi:phosphatase PAP2 family protein [Salinilacihabitans rarus]|uniref:phosphatase PAP2 family protein n=1 Tax=Salinilacihabitans rarus TaxID=2961596 RepID=UPI0020C8A239|nr:phosphatase PAP2 family protein [Salinilacihabitans rarus]
MALVGVALELAAIVTAMLASATFVIVGPRRFAAALRDFRWRLEVCALPAAVLLTVLFTRWATGDVLPELSWAIFGTNITPYLESFDRTLFGHPVVLLQSYRSPTVTALSAFVYLYGYAFLLIFPFVAYFALDEMDDLSTLIRTYTANYALGLLCYVLFIAYGPRNTLALEFDPILYETFPQTGYLTHTINVPENVFPSLHTSLATSSFLLAWLTREEYPLWTPVAGVLALGVVVSTMYLGIHWFGDVVGGVVLAAISVYAGVNYTVEGTIRSVRLFLDGHLGRTGRVGRD